VNTPPVTPSVPVPAATVCVGVAVDPAGAFTTATAVVTVSSFVFPVATVQTTVPVYVTPVRPEGFVVVKVPAVTLAAATGAATAGATVVNTPKPIEATATSAMRLKVVFVDICFLSISQNQEFPDLGFG
jgi:hypothetical protein